MKSISLSLFAAALFALASPAAALTAVNLSVKDANGATQKLCETADGSGTLTPCLQAGAFTAGGKVDTVIPSTSTNRGASFTSSAAVTLMAANAARRGLQIQNQGSSSCYMSGLGTATADFNSLLVPAGGLYESLPQHTGQRAISVICPSATSRTPVPVYAREF